MHRADSVIVTVVGVQHFQDSVRRLARIDVRRVRGEEHDLDPFLRTVWLRACVPSRQARFVRHGQAERIGLAGSRREGRDGLIGARKSTDARTSLPGSTDK